MELLGFAASLLMGITLGLMGGGGSILTVPILVYLFSVSPVAATGYSLFVVGTTALIGSLFYVRSKEVDYRTAWAFALPSVIGVNLSRAFVIPYIPAVLLTGEFFTLTKDVVIMVAFAVLMLAASYSMIRKNGVRALAPDYPALSMLRLALTGAGIGLIAGFVGAGGGFLIIPALVFIAALPMRTAVGTSLVIIAFQSLLGFSGDVARGADINWTLLLSITAFAAAGIAIGTVFSGKIKEQKLKIAFGWFVLVMGGILLTEQLHRILT